MVVPQRKTLNLYEVFYNQTLLKGLIYLLGSTGFNSFPFESGLEISKESISNITIRLLPVKTC